MAQRIREDAVGVGQRPGEVVELLDDQVQRGRLERFDEARGVADRDDVLNDVALAPPRGELEQAQLRIGELRLQRTQLELRFLLRAELRRVDVAARDHIFEIDPPAPAVFHRRHRRVGPDCVVLGEVGSRPRADYCSVAVERVAVGEVRLLQRLSQQQRAEARAVNEQVRFQLTTAGQLERADPARLVPLDADYLIGDQLRSRGHRLALEEIDERRVRDVVGRAWIEREPAIADRRGRAVAVHDRVECACIAHVVEAVERVPLGETFDPLVEVLVEGVVEVRHIPGAPLEAQAQFPARPHLLVELVAVDAQMLV